jgi:hypothetical protein
MLQKIDGFENQLKYSLLYFTFRNYADEEEELTWLFSPIISVRVYETAEMLTLPARCP